MESNRTENLLAVILLNTIKDRTLAEKALQLSLAGFTTVEIANFLETSPEVVRQSLYERRKKKAIKKIGKK